MKIELPNWIKFWFIITSIICTMDAMFILLRPHTLKGGSLEFLFVPYQDFYVKVDKLYNNTKDGFVIAQSWGNILEIIIQMGIVFFNSFNKPFFILLSFSVSLMTLYKTILYFLTVYFGSHIILEDLFHFILIFLLPSSVWIIMPLLVCLTLGKLIITSLSTENKKNK